MTKQNLSDNKAPSSILEPLQQLIPQAQLRAQSPPLIPRIKLWLLDDILRQQRLDTEVANVLMESPPYWSFCWASGQVLAAWLLEHPELVKNKTLVDLGCGSGVVAIAAALAGADQVIACDLDKNALAASKANATLNGITLDYAYQADGCLPEADVITVADILYDRDNLPLLPLLRQYATVLLADSRNPDLASPGYQFIHEQQTFTWPDLDESSLYNRVRLFSAEKEQAV